MVVRELVVVITKLVHRSMAGFVTDLQRREDKPGSLRTWRCPRGLFPLRRGHNDYAPSSFVVLSGTGIADSRFSGWRCRIRITVKNGEKQ